MLQNIDTLFAVQKLCAEGRPLTPHLNSWLANSIARFLEHECDTLNEAFEIVHEHGGVPWWRERALRTRDDALRALSRGYYSEMTVYQRAKAIAQLSNRYAATGWPRDRRLDRMPERYRGTRKAHLWRAFRSEAKMPVCERHLRNLLAD